VVRDGKLIVTITGWHRFWAFKKRVEVPLEHVEDVEINPDVARQSPGMWKLPGTYLPRVIVAGSYYGRGEWTFCDVRNPDKAAIITLSGERYRRLIVEVDDPEGTIALVRGALSRRASAAAVE
jgi:hypothetical protein